MSTTTIQIEEIGPNNGRWKGKKFTVNLPRWVVEEEIAKIFKGHLVTRKKPVPKPAIGAGKAHTGRVKPGKEK